MEHAQDFKRRWNYRSLEEYIELLIKNRVTTNGVFGFKIHFEQKNKIFNSFPIHMFIPDLVHIHIVRKDKILQGISLERAFQTGKWSSEFKENTNAQNFSYKRLEQRISDLSLQDERWYKYFKKHGIKPIRIYYEDLEENYSKEINRVLKELNIDFLDNVNLEPQIEKQRDFTSLIWKWRYIFKKLWRK